MHIAFKIIPDQYTGDAFFSTSCGIICCHRFRKNRAYEIIDWYSNTLFLVIHSRLSKLLKYTLEGQFFAVFRLDALALIVAQILGLAEAAGDAVGRTVVDLRARRVTGRRARGSTQEVDLVVAVALLTYLGWEILGENWGFFLKMTTFTEILYLEQHSASHKR